LKNEYGEKKFISDFHEAQNNFDKKREKPLNAFYQEEKAPNVHVVLNLKLSILIQLKSILIICNTLREVDKGHLIFLNILSIIF
jgi:hypothetical protein